MLSIEQTRKILGKEAKGLTDDQLTEIRDGYRHLTEVIFEKWQIDRKQKKDDLSSQPQTAPLLETPAVLSVPPKSRRRKS